MIVTGGKILQAGESIIIELEEFWTERRDSGKNSRTVTFNLQEKSFSDYLKAIFFMDRLEKPFSLLGNEIFLPDASPNVAAINAKIKPLLDEIIKSRSEYESRTPRSGTKTKMRHADVHKKSGFESGHEGKIFDPKSFDN